MLGPVFPDHAPGPRPPFAAASGSRLWPKAFLLVLLSSLSQLLPLWRRRMRRLIIATLRSRLSLCRLPLRPRLRLWVRFQASGVPAPPTTRCTSKISTTPALLAGNRVATPTPVGEQTKGRLDAGPRGGGGRVRSGCVSARGPEHDRQRGPIIPIQRNQWPGGVPLTPMGVIFGSAFTSKDQQLISAKRPSARQLSVAIQLALSCGLALVHRAASLSQ
jgi:hypothetical protein